MSANSYYAVAEGTTMLENMAGGNGVSNSLNMEA
jgi:hypothetical protein